MVVNKDEARWGALNVKLRRKLVLTVGPLLSMIEVLNS